MAVVGNKGDEMMKKILLCVMMMCFIIEAETEMFTHETVPVRTYPIVSVPITDMTIPIQRDFILETDSKYLKWEYKKKVYTFKKLIETIKEEIAQDDNYGFRIWATPYPIPDESCQKDTVLDPNKALKEWEKIIEDNEIPIYPNSLYIWNPPYLKSTFQFDYQTVNVSKLFMEQLAKSGAICEVFGHSWEYDNKIIMSGMTGMYQPIRKCKICGRKEVKKITWEER